MSPEQRRWAVGLALGLVVAVGLVAAAWRWALQEPSITVPSMAAGDPVVETGPATMAAPRSGSAPLARAWQVRLWQPLVDAPPPSAPPPPPPEPPTFSLFAITREGGQAAAAIDDPEAGLVMIPEGETRIGITVVGVGSDSVQVRWQDREIELELPR